MSQEAIKAYQGRSFSVTLRSNGGTNYLWCLTTMPQETVLAFVNSIPTSPQPGAPIDTTYTFLAIKGGCVKIGFKLLCFSNPEEDIEEVQFDVNIIPHNEAGGLKGFIRYSENAASYNIPPYGFNGVATSVEKYGYPGCCEEPTVFKYGYPGCDNNAFAYTQTLYGYPPYFKYGYPGCEDCPPVKYGYPGCVKYGYPGCQ